jgi:hypothetical protein
MSEAKTKCLICGEAIDKQHAQTEKHQKAAANVCLRIMALGFCPWHDGLRVKLQSCRIAAHDRMRKQCEKLARPVNQADNVPTN